MKLSFELESHFTDKQIRYTRYIAINNFEIIDITQSTGDGVSPPH